MVHTQDDDEDIPLKIVANSEIYLSACKSMKPSRCPKTVKAHPNPSENIETQIWSVIGM
jgi:hypothetical protein